MILNEQQRSQIFDQVFGFVSGCPEPNINTAIEMAADDFIRDIGGIRFHDAFPINRFKIVEIDAPNGGRVNGVRKVTIDGRDLNAFDFTVNLDDNGAAIVVINDNAVYLHANRPNLALVSATWMPTHRTTHLPNAFFYENVDAIRNGTLVNLFAQLKQPWGDQALLTKFTEDYNRHVHNKLYDLHAADNRGGQLNVFDPTNDWTCGGFC